MSLHIVDTQGNPVCPEALSRDSMDDGQFWDHVFNPPWHRLLGDDDPSDGAPVDLALDDPCTVCGASGACAWDSEGRPLIHAGEEDE